MSSTRKTEQLEDLEIDGSGHPELRIDGYVSDRLVLTRLFSSDASHDRVSLKADDTELIADGSDATRVVFRVVDRFGADRAFANGSVSFAIIGPAVIVGDSPLSLAGSGGVAAVWIKVASNGTGRVVVTAKHSTVGQVSVEITVISEQKSQLP